MRRHRIAPEIAAEVDAPLSVEEFDRRLASTSEEELRESVELIRWFLRRYPTARARLDFARRTYAQWSRPTQVVKRG